MRTLSLPGVSSNCIEWPHSLSHVSLCGYNGGLSTDAGDGGSVNKFIDGFEAKAAVIVSNAFVYSSCCDII